MPSSYSSSLRLELIGSGEQAGAWGNTTNKNLGTLLEEAIAGVLTIQMPANADYTLTVYNGASDQARQAALIITSAVSLTTTRNIIIPAKDKVYIVKNSTSGSQDIVVKTASGTGVTIPNGKIYLLYCDGTSVSTINTAGELGNVTSYNGQTGDVDGISNIDVDKGLSYTPTTDFGRGYIRLANTGVTSLALKNAFNPATGVVTIEKADLIKTLGYTPIDKFGTDDAGQPIATGNWGINAATATKFKYSTGEAPGIATRAWVNYSTINSADVSGVLLSQASSSTIAVTVPTGLVTKTGTYTQSSANKTASYFQGRSLTGTITYKQGAAILKNGTYTRSGTTVTASITAHGFILGQKLRLTLGSALDVTATVTDVVSANSFKCTIPTTVTPTGTTIIADYAGPLVTVTSTVAHGISTTLTGIQVDVFSGNAIDGVYNINVAPSSTTSFTYLDSSNDRLTSGSMNSIKIPDKLVTVTSTAHGLVTNDLINIPSGGILSGSVAIGTYTITKVDNNIFTITSTGSASITTWTTTDTLFYVSKGTTVTVASTAHGLVDGEKVYMGITSGGSSDGVKTITTTPSLDTFTYEETTPLLITTGGNVSFVNNGVAANQQLYLNATVTIGSVATNISGWYTVQAVTGLNTFTMIKNVSPTSATMSGTGTFYFTFISGRANVAYVSVNRSTTPQQCIINFKTPMGSDQYCVNFASSSNSVSPNYVDPDFTPTPTSVCVYTVTSTKYNYVSIVQ